MSCSCFSSFKQLGDREISYNQESPDRWNEWQIAKEEADARKAITRRRVIWLFIATILLAVGFGYITGDWWDAFLPIGLIVPFILVGVHINTPTS